MILHILSICSILESPHFHPQYPEFFPLVINSFQKITKTNREGQHPAGCCPSLFLYYITRG